MGVDLPNHALARQLTWVRRSSTLRLTVMLSLVFAVGFLVAVFVALILGDRAENQRLDATLSALALGGAATEARGETSTMILRALDDLEGLPKAFQDAAVHGGGTVELEEDLFGSEAWRARVTEDRTGRPVLVAIPIEDSLDARELQGQILWTTAAFVVALTLAIGLWVGGLAQRRLGLINATLGQLAAGDLSARTNHPRQKDDLDDIARNLDQTAAEIERLLTQTRHLSASIAHDLRTPLARLRAQLEMLPEGEGRNAALEEASKLSDIFDTIMRVARIEAGQGRAGFETVHLSELARDLAETFGPVVEDAGKTLRLDLSGQAEIKADRGMLIQAVANLLQNAIVHGGDTITLCVEGARLGVADNGAGVAPEQFSEIVKPMVRLDAARQSEGSGLGLALVRAVAERHRARLVLAQVVPQGLRATLEFTNL